MKFCLLTDSADYQGHIVNLGSLTIDEARIKCFIQVQQPRNVTELQSFLGMCSVFWCFVPSYTDIVASLAKFLQIEKMIEQMKDLPVFHEQESQAFDKNHSSQFFQSQYWISYVLTFCKLLTKCQWLPNVSLSISFAQTENKFYKGFSSVPSASKGRLTQYLWKSAGM